MMRYMWLCLLVLALAVPASGQEATDTQAEWLGLLNAASTAYNNGNLTQAADLYALLLAQGVQDVVVYYNMASVHYELGNIAQARWYYRLAQALAPRDADVAAGIERVQAQAPDAADTPQFVHVALAQATRGALTTQELAFLTLVIWVSWSILAAALIGLRQPRVWLRVGFWLMSAVLFVTLLLMGSRWYVARYEPPAIVLRSAAVYSGPGFEYVQMYSLRPAYEIYIQDEDAGWYKFVQLNGRRGWIEADAVGRLD